MVRTGGSSTPPPGWGGILPLVVGGSGARSHPDGGRLSVMASTDCGFGTFAGIGRVDPAVVVKKLVSLAEGAALAGATP